MHREKAAEPKREGLEKLFVTPAETLVMPPSIVAPIEPNVCGAMSGNPNQFVVWSVPGDAGIGWDKEGYVPHGSSGHGGTYL